MPNEHKSQNGSELGFANRVIILSLLPQIVIPNSEPTLLSLKKTPINILVFAFGITFVPRKLFIMSDYN